MIRLIKTNTTFIGGIERNHPSSSLIKPLQFTSILIGKSSNFHRRQLEKLPFSIEWKLKRNMEVSFNDLG
jgi:hypothetical protein